MRDSCYVSVIPVWAYSDNVKIKLRVFIGEKKNRPKYLFTQLSWISKPFWTIFTNKYAVPCVLTGSLIQNSFLVCTVFAFTVCKEFKQPAELQTLFYALSVGETSLSLETVISTLCRQTFA